MSRRLSLTVVPGIRSSVTGEFDPFFWNPQLPGVSLHEQEGMQEAETTGGDSAGALEDPMSGGLGCQPVLLWWLQLQIIPVYCTMFSSLALLKGHDQ